MFQPRARTPWMKAWLGLFIALAFSRCALFGGGGGNLPKAKGYDVDPPDGWQEMDKADSDRAYRLGAGGVVTLNSSCTRNSQAPLEVLTKHLLFGARNVQYVDRQKISVSGTEGLFSRVSATTEGVPFHLLLFVLPKNGCIFDFSLVSQKEVSDGDTKEFLVFIKSFKYGSK